MPPPGFMPPPMGMIPPRGPPMMPQMSMMQRINEEPLNEKNPTVYVQNLNERIKLPDLKNAIY